MQLYYSPTSPFVRKVSVLIAESGLTDRVTVKKVGGHPIDPGTLPVDLNPLGKIPALALDDGRVLYDSRVICRYLDGVSGAGLYPTNQKLWDTLVIEATADGMLEAAVLIVYEGKLRPEAERSEAWIDAQWLKIARALDHLEEMWLDHLKGKLDMGQIALGAALGYLDFRMGERNWREGRPGLAAWEAEFARRPAMRETVPVG